MNLAELIAVQKQMLDKLKSLIESGLSAADRTALCVDIKTIGEAIITANQPKTLSGFATQIREASVN